MTTDRNGITTDARGYVATRQCNVNHSGNRRLAHHSRTYYECQGCLSYYGVEELRGSAGPYTGGGGVAEREART